jgi:hypothetical protein
MIARSRFLILVGVGVLGLGGVMAAQATQVPAPMESHTVTGKMTALETSLELEPTTGAVACDQIKVNAEIWFDLDGKTTPVDPKDLPFPKEVLASTNAEGSTLGDGCTYTLTFNYSPSRQLPAFSEYRISGELPQIREGVISGYSARLSPPFAEPVDMQF